MLRKGALNVEVRMPSRGLVTRLPSESADLFRAGDTQRAFADAYQVRFEDGVVCAAPGYEKVVLTGDAGVALTSVGAPTPTVTHLATARSSYSGVQLQSGLILVAGGTNLSPGAVATAELYNPVTGDWSSAATMNTPRVFSSIALLQNGKVLVIGGDSVYGNASAEIYDPVANTWTPTPNMNFSRLFSIAVLLPSGRVLVAGGENAIDVTIATAEIYDPVANTWTLTSSMSVPRSYHMAAPVAGGALVIGGVDEYENPLASAEIYYESTGLWSLTGPLPSVRYLGSSAVLPGGSVLVAGGFDGTAALNTALLYTPSAGTWAPTGSLTTARGDAGIVLLPSGLVMMAGGNNGGTTVTTAELYNPASGTWANGGTMVSAHNDFTLFNGLYGQAIAIGGDDLSAALTASEVYSPVSNSWLDTGFFTQPAVGSSVTVSTLEDPVAGGVVVGAVLAFSDVPTTDTYRVTSVTNSPNRVTMTLLTIGGTRAAGTHISSGTPLVTANALNGPVTLVHQGNLLNPSWLLNANTLASQSTPLTLATANSLYSGARSYDSINQVFDLSTELLFTGNTSDLGVPWFASDFIDKIIFAQRSNNPQTWVSGDPVTYPLPGLPTNDALWDGVEVFFQHVILWRGDRFKWSDVDDYANYIPVGTTAASFILLTSGFTQPAPGASVIVSTTNNPVALGAVVGQYVRIEQEPYFAYYLITAVTTSSITVTAQDLTGNLPTGTVVASGTQIFSLDANEAGETQITGSDSNGPIMRVIRLGDYAFIFKNRSISSAQYVGVGSGVFFIHTEVTNEGLLSPLGVLNLGDGTLIFLGHREMYLYQGGPTLTPVCQQVTRQMYSELDRGRLYEIQLYHNEARKEVWLHYPIVGGRKVLIWNYVEDTASFDAIPGPLGAFVSLGSADWSSDLRWVDLAPSSTWSNFGTVSWLDFSTGSDDHLTLIGAGDSYLRIQGYHYTQDGMAYTALAETMDFDFGDNTIFKYVDTVVINAQVKATSSTPKNLYLQIGSKNSLEGAMRWTTPLAVNLQGSPTLTQAVQPNLVVSGAMYGTLPAYAPIPAIVIPVVAGQQYTVTFGANDGFLVNGGVQMAALPGTTTFTAAGSSVALLAGSMQLVGALVTANILSVVPTPAVRTYAPVKVNPGGSGRYIRLRLYSQDADVEWRVSTFEISCRAGGTY